MRVFVTGLPRSGTTWMMMCLKRAGMPTIAKGGRLETSEKVIGKPVVEGHAVKAFAQWLENIPVNSEDIIIWMCRHPKFIAESCRRTGIRPGKWGHLGPRYFIHMRECIDKWREQGAKVFVCRIPEVNKNPHAFFRQLTKAGVPIDVELAATTANIDKLDKAEQKRLNEELEKLNR